ncbi:HD-GYP domain-containing protein [Rubripirellula reticaptiva]|uniref:HD-GYP domain-containing protein n=1 Tax=Rubripirellula reticaptiva TaxID=2528013 RepID=UPI001648A3E3|nr:HD domain-containing phosphohydrolase [Rubripirellula reticaptiva]
MSATFARVSLSTLSVGTVLSSPIFDPDSAGTKLLGKNIEINEQFLNMLVKRGINNVVVNRRDLARLKAGAPQGIARKADDHSYSQICKTNRATSDIDEEVVGEGFKASIEMPTETVAERLGAPRQDRYDRHHMLETVKKSEQQIAYLDELFVNLIKGSSANDESLEGVCRDSVKSILDDRDMFLCLGLNPFDTEYPARHSLHVCSVAISIGLMLGLDDASLVDLGTGCLIHDVGMKMMPRKVYTEKRKLTPDELTSLAEHPVLTLDALQCPGVRISRVARIVAYQLHERCDGSGYPRGRVVDEIHPLARIAAVADAYVGLVSNRGHRKGLMPYFAIEKLLHDVAGGKFDSKSVRGLLHAVSLFPIGSFVEMSDGQVGRVVRSNGENFTRPIVEIWNARHREYEIDMINLASENSVQIVRATRAPQAA